MKKTDLDRKRRLKITGQMKQAVHRMLGSAANAGVPRDQRKLDQAQAWLRLPSNLIANW